MSKLFHSNQYEDAFLPKKLCPMRQYRTPTFPRHQIGYSQPIANEKGYVDRRAPRNAIRSHQWFISTWKLPCKIPGIWLSTTNRSQDSIIAKYKQLEDWKIELKPHWSSATTKDEKYLRHCRGLSMKKREAKLPDYMKGISFRPYYWEFSSGFKEQREELYPTPIAPPIYIHNEKRNKRKKSDSSVLCIKSPLRERETKFHCYYDD